MSTRCKWLSGNVIPGILLLIIAFLWFYFPGEYVLIANRDLSLFLWTGEYLSAFLDHPGGLLEYLGSFLNQFYRFRFPGALSLSLMLYSAYVISGSLAARISGKKGLFVIAVLTAVLLMGMHNYYPHEIAQSLGFILAPGLVLLLPSQGKDRILFLVLSVPLFYYLAGGFIWFYCGLLLAVYLVGERKAEPAWILLSTIYPLALVGISAGVLFLAPLSSLAFSPLPFGAAYGSSPWPWFFLGYMLLWMVLTRLPLKIESPGSPWWALAQSVACILGFILVLHFSFNRKNRELFQIEKLALDQNWDELLAYTGEHPSRNLFGVFYTNLALARQGKLCTGLFQYPQSFGRRGLCFSWEAKGEILRRGGDFFWTVNFVNEAHHWAFESMIVDGFTQRNLTRLIQTELVRGNFRVAEKYVDLLGKAMFQKENAQYYGRFLRDPVALASDPELGPRVNFQVNGDFFAEGMDLELNLRRLLANNPSNIRAWDYLMAIWLLEKQVDKIGEALPAYMEACEGELPPLLDEAMLVYRIAHRDEDLSHLEVRPNTLQRFDAYTRILREYRVQNEAAKVLYPNYGSSFWFYLNFVPLSNP